MLETFNIVEAGAAMGRSSPVFRRWVNGDLIPKPMLRDTTRQHYFYCRDELEIMARIIAEHEKEFAYFCASHEATSHKIHQAIHGYRDVTFFRGSHGRTV